ncbi:rhamnulokinase [Paenibacillus sp. CGMCC 1.16610]|uniref:Rhamnulokinase n=1 Tax=Paenibacillus anseongense TaxID=2682845 RepID=A0ABW9UFR1_9BACL|nr:MULTISPECIES: rhamnulokinase [Paenibacillus]MBA2943977.1 rhamnulokinase [Paenibacillus sp. CGMCC 1.16610]MVQ37866.1 rhamnulokinase [Paenibacillus anseongense]
MVSKPSSVLAFDLGASSGRAIVGRLDSEAGQVTIEEIHRFPNDPVKVGDHLHWDILRLFHELKQGILQTKQLGYTDIESLAIDSWAVDFGLLSKNGELLGNPYHYRDHQTDHAMEKVFAKVGREKLYAKTGLQFLQFNSIFQLAAIKERNAELLERAETLLMIPDLLRYFLTGEKHSEFTNATTTQLLNATTKAWDAELLEQLDLPAGLLLNPVPSGTRVGALTEDICEDLDVASIPVIAVGEHDTASAVVAVPALDDHFAFLSCGTWSLLGTETKEPVLTEQALAWNFTNEGGVYGTNRLLKNIMGLWLIQECKRTWDKEGKNLSFADLVKLAEQAKPFQSFIDPDDDMFLNPQHMPKQIQQYCRDTQQAVPQSEGEIARCILESLAFKYRFVLEWTEQLTGVTYPGLHIVGGGIQNELLCQFTASATGREVWAGPVEGSALGNLVVQWIALGYIANLREARKLIRNSFPVKTYIPEDAAGWQAAYATFCQVASRSRMK